MGLRVSGMISTSRERSRSRGPGAVAWTPATLASSESWFNGDNVVTQAEGINTATDLSGNGNDATQATASKMPDVLAGGIKSGNDAINPDSVDDFLATTAGSDALTGAFTIFGTMKGGSTSGDQMLFMWGEEATGKRRSIWITSANGYAAFSGYGGSSNLASTTAVADGSAHYIVITSNASWSVKIRVDGSEVATGSLTLNAYAGNNIGLGAIESGTEYFKNDIGDVGAFSAELSGNDLTNLETYLAGRAGL